MNKILGSGIQNFTCRAVNGILAAYNYLQIGPGIHKQRVYGLSVHIRQNNIKKGHVNITFKSSGHVNGLLPCFRFQHIVTQFCQQGTVHIHDHLLIFDNKNSARSFHRRRLWYDMFFYNIFNGWKVYLHGGSFVRLGFNKNPAFMIFNNTVNGRHAETPPKKPGCKKGFEYPFSGHLIHAFTVIAD